MFWLLLFAFCVILAILFEILGDDDKGGMFSICAFFSGVAVVIVFIFSILQFPSLEGNRTEVLSLQQEIETIRKARYSEVKGGSIIGGSLDNAQQSKALSDYINMYAIKKAEFNGELKRNKIYLTNKIYWWFGNSMFLSDKVLEIKDI